LYLKHYVNPHSQFFSVFDLLCWRDGDFGGNQVSLEEYPQITPKYPNVKVRFTGQNGNAFNLLGIMQHALRKAKIPKEEIDAFMTDATSGDYDHLLQTCMKMVEVT
jgi:hypothetical protein